jgi:hypothetical protein
VQATTAVAAMPVIPTVLARRERRREAVWSRRVEPAGLSLAGLALVCLSLLGLSLDLSVGVEKGRKGILSKGSTGVQAPRRRQGDVDPERARRGRGAPGRARASRRRRAPSPRRAGDGPVAYRSGTRAVP